MKKCQTHRLVVGSEETIPATDLDRYSRALEEALVNGGVGTVGVSATSLEPDEWNLRSSIEITVSDLESGVRVLRHSLRSLGVPDATWIWQREPELVTYEVWGIDEDNPPSWGW